ncbi:TPA: hypothetical protein U1247_001969 [Streptococcus suis]|nr:hypothetical protein [Streptococcus suis]
MLTFLDHKGNEIGALTTFTYTNSVNGERSLSGTVHGNLEIEKGWGVRFEDEYYKVIYAKPKSLGKINIVQFDAVHQFFWDFDKSSVYSELDGSYPFQTFLDHIFNGSGYRYSLEVEVGSLRKQNFGLKKRLELFNDLIKHAGVEFQVRGKVVRILERTGTDLSTVVRKKLNLNDLSIEKRIGDFITYQKGLGAWHDENDHSKGRLEVEYVSPLAAIYGRLEGEPYVDERFTIAENFLGVLKKSVEDSYSISVQLAMEDLQKAGYRYTRPLAGDYITVIDEDINFKERVRIVSFETKYDIKGQVIDHTITCNDIGSVKKQSAGYSSLKSSVANVSKETESAIQTANRALVSADGKTTVYFGTEFPQDIPKGTLTKGDTLYLEVGDTTKMYYWNGAEWLEPPVVNDVEAFKESINTEIAQVNQSMQAQSEEHDRQVADILSKTQSVESLANQAKSDAASALARANQVKTEAIADARAQVATVSQALNAAKTELQSAIASADQKARDSQASATALRNDLNLQASKILAQAQAQTALTNRVSTVETLADGTRSTVAELSKTVSKATGDIASVSSRTKTVEDTLSQTRTQYEALTQTVNSQTGQIESINRKTADLQSGIDGVTERFENLRVGGENLLLNAGFEGAKDSSERFTVGGVTYVNKTMPYWHNFYNGGIQNPTTSYHALYKESFEGKGPVIEFNESNGQRNWKALYQTLQASDLRVGKYTFSADIFATGVGTKIRFGIYYYNKAGQQSFHSGLTTIDISTINKWHRVSGNLKLNDDIDFNREVRIYIYAYNFTTNSILYLTKPQLEEGTVATAFSLAQETIHSEIAEYRRTADQNYAGLQSTVSTLDGKVTQNKTEANQTATQLSNRLTSLETYKDGESTRASQYLTASRTETAKQLSAERTAIATNYVAKSTYDENVRGTALKLNEIKTTADTAKQNLATYQNTVDRKLEELTTSTQTLDGKINTASAKVDTVAGQIRTEISTVEAKIPTYIGGRNLILNSNFNDGTKHWSINGSASVKATGMGNAMLLTDSGVGGFYTKPVNLEINKLYTISFLAKSNSETLDSGVYFGFLNESSGKSTTLTIGTRWKRYVYTTTTILWNPNSLFHFYRAPNTGTHGVYITNIKIEKGNVATDWSPAPEDLIDELSSVKTTITQTASGVEQLSTSLTTTNNKVSTAETKIRQLISDVSSKVSQTDYNTLTGRVDSAESAITQNATEISKRLTSTQVESAITSKGYQTKSDVDSNITGRGYITSSALQPYALSTTVQNLVQETATSFSRTISRVENKIPTKIGVTNLLGGTSSDWKTIRVTQYNSLIKSYNPQEWALLGIKTGDSVTFSVDVKTTSGKKLRSRISFYGANTHYYSEAFVANGEGRLSVTGVVPDGITSVRLFVDANLTMTTNTEVTEESCRREKLEKGAIPTDWSPAPEDLATVTALHSVRDTVDSHTRTISTINGTVSTLVQTAAGLVTEVSGTNGLKTQVSQLKNSWAVKISGPEGLKTAINASEDGVRLKGKNLWLDGNTLINNAVITSAMIAGLDAGKINTGELNAARIKANSIDGSKIVFDQAFLNKMTANEAYLRQLFAKDAFLTAVQAVSISASQISGGILTATNGAVRFDLNNANLAFNQNATINFNSDNNALVRKKGDVTAFINFADDPVSGGVYVGIGVTSHAVGVTTANNSDRGKFAGMRVYRPNDTLDLVRLIGDTITLAHGTEGRYFSFKPSQLRNNVDMLKLAGAVYTLSRIFMHLSANGWAFDHPNFIKGVKEEMARNWLQDFANEGLPR